VRDLLCSCDHADLIQRPDLRTEPTVNTKHLAINDSRQSQEIKNLTTSFPHGCIAVLLLAFFIKPINLCDLSRLVVATDERYTIWISGFKSALIFSVNCFQCKHTSPSSTLAR
jgi:hypothetical protein